MTEHVVWTLRRNDPEGCFCCQQNDRNTAKLVKVQLKKKKNLSSKHYKLSDVTSLSNIVRKELEGWILPDQSWLVRSAGSGSSILAVTSTSTASPPPRVGHGWMWVEWSGTHLCRALTICFLFLIRNIFHTQFESSRHEREDWDPSWGDLSAASSATLVSSSIKHQLLPLISPSHPHTHTDTESGQPAKRNQQLLRSLFVAQCAKLLTVFIMCVFGRLFWPALGHR